MAITQLAATIAATYFFDALLIDLVTVAVFFLGGSVIAGSIRAAKWSLAIMIYYFAFSTFSLVAVNVWPERLRLGGRPLSETELPWAVACFASVAISAALCALLLFRGLRANHTASA